MYPRHDLRALVHSSDHQLVQAISREPFPEILRHWESYKSMYPVFCEGIERAVAKRRYPLHHLKQVVQVPELVPCVIAGLEKLWSTFSCTLEASVLYIDVDKGAEARLSPEDLVKVMYKQDIDLCVTNVVVSERAQAVMDLAQELYYSGLGRH